MNNEPRLTLRECFYIQETMVRVLSNLEIVGEFVKERDCNLLKCITECIECVGNTGKELNKIIEENENE